MPAGVGCEEGVVVAELMAMVSLDGEKEMKWKIPIRFSVKSPLGCFCYRFLFGHGVMAIRRLAGRCRSLVRSVYGQTGA
jgi:hypothetical protein